MTSADIRRLYWESMGDPPAAGKPMYRWDSFDRDCVGVLLDEIGRLENELLMRMSEREFEEQGAEP